ncbi:MAG: hypothetical protein GX815_05165 [Clostridiales bacterium]|nr:hypothetical protein [Clostridiales bacterium]
MMSIKKKSVKWVAISIAITIIAVVSLWTFLSRQANQDKSYPGAKFIEYHSEVMPSAKL